MRLEVVAGLAGARTLRKVFSVLERLGEISFFDDKQIPPGAEWEMVITEQIKSATAAVLLVSRNFLESDFIARVELPKILERRPNVLWIHLSPSNVEQVQPVICKFQSLSTDPKITLNDLAGRDEDLRRELERISERVAEVLRRS